MTYQHKVVLVCAEGLAGIRVGYPKRPEDLEGFFRLMEFRDNEDRVRALLDKGLVCIVWSDGDAVAEAMILPADAFDRDDHHRLEKVSLPMPVTHGRMGTSSRLSVDAATASTPRRGCGRKIRQAGRERRGGAAKVFGAEPDMRPKPYGDNGIDLELLLLNGRQMPWWFEVIRMEFEPRSLARTWHKQCAE